jgi:hypothetical protein
LADITAENLHYLTMRIMQHLTLLSHLEDFMMEDGEAGLLILLVIAGV